MSAFEFDPQKSASNKAKRGIDLVEAQALWLHPIYEEVAVAANHEMRYLNVDKIGARHWTAIVSYRGARRRIISVYVSNLRQIECCGRFKKRAS